MDQLEKVEKIIEKTGVSYEEAKAALSEANDDLLDAIILLENQGKIKKPQMSAYTTKTEESSEVFREAAKAYEDSSEKFGNVMVRFLKWIGQLIKKGCENFFIVKRYEQEVINAPVIVLILLLLFAFWIIVPLMVVGMFFGYSYRFSGSIAKSVNVNQACDKAAEAAESFKREFTK